MSLIIPDFTESRLHGHHYDYHRLIYRERTSPPPPLFLQTLDIGPRCQENAYLPFCFSFFLASIPPVPGVMPSAFAWGWCTPTHPRPEFLGQPLTMLSASTTKIISTLTDSLYVPWQRSSASPSCPYPCPCHSSCHKTYLCIDQVHICIQFCLPLSHKELFQWMLS